MMTRIVVVLAAAFALSVAAPAPDPQHDDGASNSVFQIDISPEEAQKYLNSPPFTSPQLSSRTATLPLVRWDDPRFRSAEAGPTNGHYWKNGHEIENTNDYEEEVYDAQQFHGQDGLGAYAYGYKAPESSKVENRARSGDVSGAYEFKAGNNEIIKVRYWADSEGFHQEDNVPRDLPKPPEEPEDIRQARLAHEKAWQEAAAAAAQQPDPQGEYNPGNQQQQYQNYQGAYDRRSASVAPSFRPQSNQLPREGKSYQSYSGQQQQYNQNQPCSNCGTASPAVFGRQQGQSDDGDNRNGGQGQFESQQNHLEVHEGQASQQQPQYRPPQGQPGEYGQRQSRQHQGHSGQQQQGQLQPEEPEPTGPPRGFFYSFNYPVSIIARKGGDQGEQPGQFGRTGRSGQPDNQGEAQHQQHNHPGAN